MRGRLLQFGQTVLLREDFGFKTGNLLIVGIFRFSLQFFELLIILTNATLCDFGLADRGIAQVGTGARLIQKVDRLIGPESSTARWTNASEIWTWW